MATAATSHRTVGVGSDRPASSATTATKAATLPTATSVGPRWRDHTGGRASAWATTPNATPATAPPTTATVTAVSVTAGASRRTATTAATPSNALPAAAPASDHMKRGTSHARRSTGELAIHVIVAGLASSGPTIRTPCQVSPAPATTAATPIHQRAPVAVDTTSGEVK